MKINIGIGDIVAFSDNVVAFSNKSKDVNGIVLDTLHVRGYELLVSWCDGDLTWSSEYSLKLIMGVKDKQHT